MPELTSPECTCRVFTFKEGLLATVAHDLEIDVERWSLQWDPSGPRLSARFDAGSLRVCHAMRQGTPSPSALNAHEKSEIEKNIVEEVLRSHKHPEIVFVSTDVHATHDGGIVRGHLSLLGVERALVGTVVRRGDRFSVRVVLHLADFGIKPFSAMFGALKVKPDVHVEVSVPIAAVPLI